MDTLKFKTQKYTNGRRLRVYVAMVTEAKEGKKAKLIYLKAILEGFAH